jgi:hypothetical protein
LVVGSPSSVIWKPAPSILVSRASAAARHELWLASTGSEAKAAISAAAVARSVTAGFGTCRKETTPYSSSFRSKPKLWTRESSHCASCSARLSARSLDWIDLADLRRAAVT